MRLKSLIPFAAAAMMSPAAMAVPFGDGGAALQGVLDGIATDGSNDVSAATDHLGDGGDSYWQIGGSGGSVNTVIVEIAAWAGTNTAGIYDMADPTNKVELFSGGATTGSQALVSILLDGSVNLNFADTGVDFAGNRFGYYLDATVGNGRSDATFYSDSGLNADGFDHMAAYQGVGEQIQIGGFAPGPWGANEYVFAWEDIYGGGDKDFTDFVFLAESVSPVPEPGTLALLGLGLLGAGYAGRRRRSDS